MIDKNAQRPRIGFLIPRLGITDRGAEVLVYELAKNLHRDFEIIIWVRYASRHSKMISDLEHLGVVIEKVKSISQDHPLARILYVFEPLKPILEKFHLAPVEIEMLVFSFLCLPGLLKVNIDILFPANGLWGVFVCRILRLLRGTPFVYASLGGIEPLIAKQKPDTYIAINPGIKQWLKTHYPELHVVLISTGVDLKKFSPAGKKARLNLPRPIFITVSALVPEKRLDLTIKAVGRLKKGSLLIVGNGPLKLPLIREAQKYLGPGRFLFQRASYQKLDEFYRSADVFTHAAPWELGWSMVQLEALATNLPVVANKEENLEKLLNGVGITCNVTNSHEYANAMKQALTLKPDNRPRKAVENFSWEKIAKQYKKYLYQLLK